MKEMRMALPWPSLKVPFWEAFRPGSSMPSAAPAPGPLLQAPSPQLPGLGLGEEEGEEAVPLGNIPTERDRCGSGLGRSPCALAACALPRLKTPSSQLTAAWRRLAERSSCGERGSYRGRPGASPKGCSRAVSCSSVGPGHTGAWRDQEARAQRGMAIKRSGSGLVND